MLGDGKDFIESDDISGRGFGHCAVVVFA